MVLLNRSSQTITLVNIKIQVLRRRWQEDGHPGLQETPSQKTATKKVKMNDQDNSIKRYYRDAYHADHGLEYTRDLVHCIF